MDMISQQRGKKASEARPSFDVNATKTMWFSQMSWLGWATKIGRMQKIVGILRLSCNRPFLLG
jgi:hypothetical protein